MEFVDEKIAEVDAQIAADRRSRRRFLRIQGLAMAFNVVVLVWEAYMVASYGVRGWGWFYLLSLVITIATIVYVVRGYIRLKAIWDDTDKSAAKVREHLVHLNEMLDRHVRDHPAPIEKEQ